VGLQWAQIVDLAAKTMLFGTAAVRRKA